MYPENINREFMIDSLSLSGLKRLYEHQLRDFGACKN